MHHPRLQALEHCIPLAMWDFSWLERRWEGAGYEDWIKEINQHAISYALSKKRWLGMCTSNFCGPQFFGMWRDVGWHREWTKEIKRHPLPNSEACFLKTDTNHDSPHTK